VAIGYVYLDPDYINERHWEHKWHDQPENSRLLFHFDPSDIKFDVKTKWKPGNKDRDVNGELEIPWLYEDDTSPSVLGVKLMFTDYAESSKIVPTEGKTRRVDTNRSGTTAVSTQRSLEILEAMSLPIREKWYQELNQKVIGPILASEYFWRIRGKKGPISVEELTPAGEQPRFHAVDVTQVTGKRLVDHVWHPPRPLILKLITQEDFRCVIQNLAIDIIAIDNMTGHPTVAIANVEFVEWPDYRGTVGNGLVIAANEKVDEITSLKEWTKKVQSGEIREATQAKSQTVANYYFLKVKPTER
jgi:hypothetical protein